jgi:zinc transporter ZupT
VSLTVKITRKLFRKPLFILLVFFAEPAFSPFFCSAVSAGQGTRYAEIGWEDLLPATGKARPVLAGLNPEELADNDPRAVKALEEYMAESQKAGPNLLLQGKAVQLRGFVVPLERERESGLKEFLLVPYFGACIQVPPPPPNQIVHVTRARPREGLEAMDRGTVRGNIFIAEQALEQGRTSYTLEADLAEAGTRSGGTAPAMLLTLFCGLTVCLGGMAGLSIKQVSPGLLCLCFSFAAGVILCLGLSAPFLVFRREGVAAFLAGAALMACLGIFARKTGGASSHAGEFSALAIAAHNFPEGFALFSAAMAEPVLGLTLGGAMIAHTIPMGIAITLPIHYSSHSRLRALAFTLFSGLAPALGAVLGYAALRPLFSQENLRLLLAGVGGLIAGIAVMELLPSARHCGGALRVGCGFCAGVVFMLCTLLLVRL